MVWPAPLDMWTRGPLVIGGVNCVGVSTLGAMHDIFSSVVRAGKEKESLDRVEITFPFAFLRLSPLSSFMLDLSDLHLHPWRSVSPSPIFGRTMTLGR
jgi:hypothetical protein